MYRISVYPVKRTDTQFYPFHFHSLEVAIDNAKAFARMENVSHVCVYGDGGSMVASYALYVDEFPPRVVDRLILWGGC